MTRTNAARLALACALAGGISYFASWGLPIPHWASLAWKGSGVGFLALYAALSARNADGWWLTAVMALGAAGDVLLDLSMTVGGATFLLGHLAAIGLYVKNRRGPIGAAALAGAGLFTVAVAAAGYLLPAQRAGAAGFGVYAAVEAVMASAALLSRFPRGVTGAGALMFVVSDLLLFARLGPLAGRGWVSVGVWGLYFAGQALVCVSVARACAREARRP